MNRKIKALFIAAISAICMLNPACKHGTNDGREIYRRYAIKNIILIPHRKL